MLGSFILLWLLDGVWRREVSRAWHAGTTWLLVFLLAWAGAATMNLAVPESSTWSQVMWALVPVAVALALVVFAPLLPWPIRAHPQFYTTVVPAAPLGGALLWAGWAITAAGDPAPIPYVPMLNPLEIVQAATLVVTVIWAQRAGRISSGPAAAGEAP